MFKTMTRATFGQARTNGQMESLDFLRACLSGVQASLQVIRDELIPEIKALCRRQKQAAVARASGLSLPRPSALSLPRPSAVSLPRQSALSLPRAAATGRSALSLPRPAPAPIGIVAIGVSTGGPNALAEVFSVLPPDLPVPIVIVQHMPPMFTRLLAQRLSAKNSLPVEEGRPGALLEPGRGWIAPGDFHMMVAHDGKQARLLLHQDPPECSCRPAADVLFRSVAQTFGPATLAVVMTGMGQDGLRGCEAIHAAGGQILAQDEESSVVWGMPGFVVRAGLADKVLPLSQIGTEIVRRVKVGARNP
jgi:two-component system chemotaxis response regulator CheB